MNAAQADAPPADAERTLTLKGAAADLFTAEEPEIVMEGPAGTGKTMAVCLYAHWVAEQIPGCRILFARKTRASMTESVLVTYEQKVVSEGHPALHGGADRGHRKRYDYPNGSSIILAGLDNPDRIMSTEYDLICVFEATEITQRDYEQLKTRLRNGRIFRRGRAWHQIVLDLNPEREDHWINRLADRPITEPGHSRRGQPTMRRLLSRHRDNPAVTPQYLEALSTLTGARRQRLYLGKWASSEGQIWPSFDRRTHCITPEQARKLRVRWHLGSMDFGFRNPGVLQIWGVTADDQLVRKAEVYYTEQGQGWWATTLATLDERYNLRAVYADPEDPSMITMLNDRLSWNRRKRGEGRGFRVVRAANNDVLSGLYTVEDALNPNQRGGPRMLFVSPGGHPLGIDRARDAQGLPTSTEQEIPSYVWLKAEDGKEIKEKPDPVSQDHGCDATRYAAMGAWGQGPGDTARRSRYKPGTLGAILEHDKVTA